MDKQTTLAFILIGGILVLWLYLNSPEPPKPQLTKKSDTTSTVVDSPKIVQNKQPVNDTKVQVTPGTTSHADSLAYGRFFPAPTGNDKKIIVENDHFVIEFSSKGANISRYYLKDFNNWYSAGKNEDSTDLSTKVQLIDTKKGNAYDLLFITSDAKAINTSDLEFKANSENSSYKIFGKDSVVLTFTLTTNTGGTIQKAYTIRGSDYGIKSDIILTNMNDIISKASYDLLWNNGIRSVEHNSVDEATHSSASAYSGDEQVVIDASDEEKVNKDLNGRVDWIAVRNKYFAAIISPNNPGNVEGAYIDGSRKVFSNHGVKENYDIRLSMQFKNSAYEKNSFLIYIGPVDYGILKNYSRKLEALVDFGSFFGLKFIVRPIAEYVLLPLFNFLHMFIPNYGFVIIVFSLIIKIVVYPLTKQSYQSMKKMQLLQPKMAEIKEKYKDDPQKVNKETMKLYSTYGINPAGGCFPLLLQMPIFVALWGLFQVAIDLRQQPFVFWITDLSTPDVIMHLPFQIPFFGISQISGLALLMGVTTFFQQKMSIKDPKQQALVYIMPVFLTIMFMSFPSGLNLYYFMFNVFSIAQQSYINHKHDGMVLEPVKNPKKSKGFMQKLMDAAEQNTKAAQQQKRKR